jgi:hypothetical protein
VADWAVDGDPNSRWASDGPNDAEGPNPEWQWLELDLGGIRFIDSINLQWERAYSRNYAIQISDDDIDDSSTNYAERTLTVYNKPTDTVGNCGEVPDTRDITWKTVREFPFGKGGEVEMSMLDVRARYVRIFSFEGDRNYGISLYEVKIFGDSNVDCTRGPTTCRQAVIGLGAAAASASSEESSHKGPEKAIDGDMSTRWSSKFNDGEWFAVDLGKPTLVYSVWLFWERAYAGSYELQTANSLDGPWTQLVLESESDGETDILDGLHVVTQYMRLLSLDRATRYGNSLWEFEVRGTQEEVCTSISTPTSLPSTEPSQASVPVEEQSDAPSDTPSQAPTLVTPSPVEEQSDAPSDSPSQAPTITTPSPLEEQSDAPSDSPSQAPTIATPSPVEEQSDAPSDSPSQAPTPPF